MKKVILSFVIVSLILLTSCGGNENTITDDGTQNNTLNEANGSRLDFAISEKYNSLDPINITNVNSWHIASQIYESLLRFDENDLSIQPLLAESWTVSDDNLVLTIQLKKGVYFQDNTCFEGGKGREFKSSDVIYTFERIYSKASENYSYTLFKGLIKGGEDYKTLGGEISGLKAIDDYSIEITLSNPSANFLDLLATISSGIIPKEAVEKNQIVGTGPFVYDKANDKEQSLVLVKNQNYHLSDEKGNKLPYLGSVAFSYVKPGQDQLDLFMNDKLDIITGLPPESIKEIVESQIADFQDKPVKYVLGRYPQVSTSFLNLNTSIAPFNNLKVRQALNMAINKSKIVDDVLRGEAYGPGEHGIVPSAIKNYDFSSVVGQEYDVNKAKKLLAEAGYPNGKGFPTLKFATGQGNTSIRVGLEIQKQLMRNLNINVEISSLQLIDIMEMNSRSELNMSLNGWLGEFPDPLTFLSLFYGANLPSSNEENSYPNESRYRNAEFDKLYEQALVTIDTKKRYELCLTADQIVATEVPVIPLWYHENYQLIQSIVKGYQPNSMNIQYLTHVKIEESKAEEK